MSRVPAILAFSLVAVLLLSFGWIFNSVFAVDNSPDDTNQPPARVSPQTVGHFTFGSYIEPGLAIDYYIYFTASSDLPAGVGQVTVELEHFGFPTTIDRSHISIGHNAGGSTCFSGSSNERVSCSTPDAYRAERVPPQEVSVSGESLLLTIGDTNPKTDQAEGVQAKDSIEIVIRQSAGVTTPTEGGDYAAVITNNQDDIEITTSEITVPRLLGLKVSGSYSYIGSVVTATGRGFKNGTFLTFFLDTNGNGTFDAGEPRLCEVPAVGVDDTGSCSFTASSPPFSIGDNWVDAVDGRGQRASNNISLTLGPTPTPTPTPTPAPSPTITLSAASGAPGTMVTIRGDGFKTFVPVRGVSVGGINVLPAPAPSTNAQGMTEFDILIPGLDSGIQTIEVQVSDTTARVGFTVTTAAAPTPTPLPAATPTPAPTTEPPQLPGGGNEPPHIFIGTANLNGSPAGTGVAIDAYDAGRLIGATVTQAGGRFSIHVHRAEGVITFRVNNQAATESWTAWRTGQVTTGFNLTAGGVSSNETDPARLFAALPALVRAFNFDNATKRWDFFDPAAAEVSTLTRFIPQHAYWLLVSHTTRLLLNGVERDLFCVADNCWNIIVW